ncbi:hypothetical protein A2Z22_00175 [Candidatus Woesebacteria bacterium RBG_16_34_12]|uniref:Uncharacterized protein n=1 Tax=Candidatus Woesebacteria bacterium RBG_16_34_12 TaxID=1802480 RepID=A0A1F7X8U2_9BACT|nr:MAG: hypothetical protein A2Z22_00175 [Candidatus Woesebacteria bacterium RBG_16_34_12]
MLIFGKEINQNSILNPNIRVMIIPSLSLIIIITLFIVVVKTSIPKISEQMNLVKNTDENVSKLNQKLDILREVKDKVLGYADTSLLAVPDENPILWKMAQLKSITSENEMHLLSRSVDVKETQGGGINDVEVIIAASGSLAKAMDYIKAVQNSSPISNIESVSIKRISENDVEVHFTVKTFHSRLPTKLPKISEPIKNLTSKEQDLLEDLSKLKAPEFTMLEPNGPFDRLDPFN